MNIPINEEVEAHISDIIIWNATQQNRKNQWDIESALIPPWR